MFEDTRRNGSPPPQFDFDPTRTDFRVTLPAHPEYVVLDALRDATTLRLHARDLLERVLQLGAPPQRHGWAWLDLGHALEGLGAPRSEVRAAYEGAARRLPGESRVRAALSRVTGGA